VPVGGSVRTSNEVNQDACSSSPPRTADPALHRSLAKAVGQALVCSALWRWSAFERLAATPP
jgi:hypothetical protein